MTVIFAITALLYMNVIKTGVNEDFVRIVLRHVNIVIVGYVMNVKISVVVKGVAKLTVEIVSTEKIWTSNIAAIAMTIIVGNAWC